MALRGDPYAAAVELVKAGLMGDTIKLHGCQSNQSAENARKNGEMDAAYLDALIKGLVKTLS